MTAPAPRDLRQDLLAAGLGLVALAALVLSCVFGGWPFVLAWAAVILGLCALTIGMHEVTEPHKPDGRAPADDDNALQIAQERGPDTT